MCGIFGYMGPKQAAPILVEGLRRLEYRGYDSSGIALKNGDFSIYKKTGKVVELQAILPDKLHGNLGIAHKMGYTWCSYRPKRPSTSFRKWQSCHRS